MSAVLRLLPLASVALLLAACGGSSARSTPVDLGAAARGLTSARFAITIKATVAGVAAQTEENGTISFTARRAHVYKLTGGSGEATPVELIYDGNTVYSNANVMLAMADPSVKPWIRQGRLATHLDDVDHVRALALLATAATGAQSLGRGHYRAQVEPNRLAQRLRDVVRTDYRASPFPAEFWLDGKGLLTRVLVSYRTAKGGQITVDGTFTEPGATVDVTPPAPGDVETVSSPRR
jgi:hypothetical protein